MLQRILENNLAIFVIAGAGVYVLFYTEIGKGIQCVLNPTKCLQKPLEDLKDLGEKAEKVAQDVYNKMNTVPVVEKKYVPSSVHTTEGGFEVVKVGEGSAKVVNKKLSQIGWDYIFNRK